MNRQRANVGSPRVNAKRVYRVMAGHALLLPKAPRRRQSSRPHEGKVAVSRSDMRWCSDGFEIKWDLGADRDSDLHEELLRSDNPGLPGLGRQGLPREPAREMLIGEVEKRFVSVEGIPEAHALEFLSDNGSAYIAAETRDRPATGLAVDQHGPVQPAKQWHGLELRQHLQA